LRDGRIVVIDLAPKAAAPKKRRSERRLHHWRMLARSGGFGRPAMSAEKPQPDSARQPATAAPRGAGLLHPPARSPALHSVDVMQRAHGPPPLTAGLRA
jgi:hypothetical protein